MGQESNRTLARQQALREQIPPSTVAGLLRLAGRNLQDDASGETNAADPPGGATEARPGEGTEAQRDEATAGRPGGGLAAPQPTSAESSKPTQPHQAGPSWLTVLATTARLWARRHLPPQRQPGTSSAEFVRTGQLTDTPEQPEPIHVSSDDLWRLRREELTGAGLHSEAAPPELIREPEPARASAPARRRRLVLYALAAASIVVAGGLADHWGVLPRVGANTSSSPARVGGPSQRPRLLPPLDQPPVMHFGSAADATPAPAGPSARPTRPAAGRSGTQNPAARPAGSPASAGSPQSAAGESSGGGPSAIARGGGH